MAVQLSEARAFEMLGRLHAENRLLVEEVEQLTASGRQVMAALEQARAELDALRRDVPEPADDSEGVIPQKASDPRRKGR